MGRKLILASMLLMALVISINVSALDSDQKSVILTVEAGKTVYFDIYMSGGGSADITHSGDINKWVSHDDSISSGEWLEVKVAVPDDADIKSYSENILADGTVITKLTVVVTAPVSSKLNTIQNKINDLFDEQDDLEEYIQKKLGETNTKVTNLEVVVSDINDCLSEMKSMQKDVNEVEGRLSADKQLLQQMIDKLEGDKTELEQENRQLNDMTGMMSVNWSSAGFALGVIVVLVVLFLYFKIGPRIGRGSFSVGSPSVRGRMRKSSGSHASAPKELSEERLEDETRIKSAPGTASTVKAQERIRGRGEFNYSFKAR